MATRVTKTLMRGAAVSLVLGMAVAVSGLPVGAQAPTASTSAEAGTTSAPPQSSDLDANYWALVRDSKDPGAVQSYLESFPSGRFATQARDKLASLREQQPGRSDPYPSREASVQNPGLEPGPAVIQPVPAATPAPSENKDLARALQQELKRVGCLSGEVDGVWGDQSRVALKEFVRQAKLNMSGDEPNISALDAASAARARVCPLACNATEKVVGDRCVPAVVNTPPRQVRQQPAQHVQPRRAWAEQPEARESSNTGKRICFGARPNEIVACQ